MNIHPEDLLNPQEGRLTVENSIDFSTLSKPDQKKLIDGVMLQITKRNAPLLIGENENFDVLYCASRHFSYLALPVQQSLLNFYQSAIGALGNSITQLLKRVGSDEFDAEAALHKNATKIYAFLLQWALSDVIKGAIDAAAAAKLSKKGAKSKPTGKSSKKNEDAGDDDNNNNGDDEDDNNNNNNVSAPTINIDTKVFANDADGERLLSSLINLLEVDLQRIWRTSVEEECLNLFANVAYRLLECASVLRSKSLKRCIYQLLCTLVKRYAHSLAVTQSLVHLLRRNETLASTIAELLAMLGGAEYQQTKAVGDVIREIGSVGAKDSAAVKSFATFLPELAQRCPSLVLANISLLVAQLDSESYTMRNGVVQVIGHLARDAFRASENDTLLANTRDSLLQILEERVRDVHAFTRSKVLQTWQSLVEAKCVPLVYLPSVTKLTVGRLEDKSANVRKHAMSLLRTLLQFNPYAGDLRVVEFTVERARSLAAVERKLGYELRAHDKALLDGNDDDDTTVQQQQQNNDNEIVMNSGVAMNDVDGDLHDANSEVGDNNNDNNDNHDEKVNIEQEAAVVAAPTGPIPDASLTDDDIAKLRAQRKYLRHSIRFIWTIEDAVPHVLTLLGSRVASDLLEAIQFFVVASEFRIEPAQIGVRKMLALIWSKESSVKTAIENACRTLYLTPRVNGTAQQDALCIASSLMALLPTMCAAEFVSFEQVLVSSYVGGHVSPMVIDVLWRTVALSLSDATDADARHAMILLSMFALADAKIVEDRMQLLGAAALSSRWRNDPQLATYAAIALQRMRVALPNNSSSNSTTTTNVDDKKKVTQQAAAAAAPVVRMERLPTGHEMIRRLADVVLDCTVPFSAWLPAAHEAIGAIFALSARPERAAAALLRRLGTRVLTMQRAATATSTTSIGGGGDEKNINIDDDNDINNASGGEVKVKIEGETTNNDDNNNNNNADVNDEPTNNASQAIADGVEIVEKIDESAPKSNEQSRLDALSKLVMTVGEIALKQLTYIESVHAELQARAGTEKKSTNNKNARKFEAIETELGEAAAKENDAADVWRENAERELCALINTYGVLVTRACKLRGNACEVIALRAAGVLTLCKLMLISDEYCQQHLSLLFTLLEREHTPSIRANIVVCLGDLLTRHPNTVDPWLSRIFACLADNDGAVRQQTLSVLSHLILNDQIKAKTHMAKLAFSLEDADSRVRALARLFFTQLAERNQQDVYNLIPDAISRLSRDEQHRLAASTTTASARSEGFRSVMKYLLAFVQKDKNNEALVQKLCQRFARTADVQQWRDLAFCLAQLPLNERGLKRLLDASVWRLVQAALGDEDVYGHFASMVAKARKLKAEFRALVDEFEKRLTDDFERATGRKVALASAAATAKRNAAATPGKKGKGKARGGKAAAKKRSKIDDDDDDDDDDIEDLIDDDDDEDDNATQTTTTDNNEKKKKKKNNNNNDDLDDDDDDDDVDSDEKKVVSRKAAPKKRAAPTKSKATGKRIAATKNKNVAKKRNDDDDEDDDDNDNDDDEFNDGDDDSDDVASARTKKAKIAQKKKTVGKSVVAVKREVNKEDVDNDAHNNKNDINDDDDDDVESSKVPQKKLKVATTTTKKGRATAAAARR